LRFFEWFYPVPLVNVSWGASEFGAVLRSVLSFTCFGAGGAKKLEREVAGLTGAAEAVAFERGRSGLRWILEWGRNLPGADGRKQVIFPSLLCGAVRDSVCAAGLEPMLCDVTSDLSMDFQSASELFDAQKTLAFVVPHIYGRPSPVGLFAGLAASSGALVIDDAAASIGQEMDGRPSGMHGDAGLYSFSQGKSAVAGGGGVLVLPEGGAFQNAAGMRPPVLPPSWRRAAFIFTRFLWQDMLHRFSGPMDKVLEGARARLRIGGGGGTAVPIENRAAAGIFAAVAAAQVRKLETMAEKRRQNMVCLAEELSDIPGLRVLSMPDGCVPTRFVVETAELRVERDASGIRKENPLAVHLRGRGIEARYAYLPVHLYGRGKEHARSILEVSERLGERLLLLPVYPPLGRGQMARIGNAVRLFFG